MNNVGAGFYISKLSVTGPGLEPAKQIRKNKQGDRRPLSFRDIRETWITGLPCKSKNSDAKSNHHRST